MNTDSNSATLKSVVVCVQNYSSGAFAAILNRISCNQCTHLDIELQYEEKKQNNAKIKTAQ